MGAPREILRRRMKEEEKRIMKITASTRFTN
jgi:hypothetical protein